MFRDPDQGTLALTDLSLSTQPGMGSADEDRTQ